MRRCRSPPERGLRRAPVRRTRGGHGVGAPFNHALEHTALVARVLLDRLHQLGNEVVAALQLYLDVTPGSRDPRTVPHQQVVGDGAPHREAQRRMRVRWWSCSGYASGAFRSRDAGCAPTSGIRRQASGARYQRSVRGAGGWQIPRQSQRASTFSDRIPSPFQGEGAPERGAGAPFDGDATAEARMARDTAISIGLGSVGAGEGGGKAHARYGDLGIHPHPSLPPRQGEGARHLALHDTSPPWAADGVFAPLRRSHLKPPASPGMVDSELHLRTTNQL